MSHYQRSREIFLATAALPVAERAQFLDETCEDAEIRREVEELLALDDESGFLEEGQNAVLAEDALSERFWVNRSIGNYRLISQIGSGGSGRVFEATRDDEEFERTVAVKVLRWEANDPDTMRRFQREKRILARLRHPNIAALIDAGATEDGIPYVVMEMVSGRPITECFDNTSMAQRLGLFAKVCDAVDYAHRRLIVHRDIKPANILVSTDGHPLLLDFGIASLIDSADHTQTLTSARRLTPRYASPEQLAGTEVSTYSDIYSLGLLLYELCSGRAPIDTTGLSLPKLLEARAKRPEPPSQAVLKPPDQKGRVGRPLGRQFWRDLDTIAMRALRYDPEERYPSARELGEDVTNAIAGRPIRARPIGWGLRLWKWVLRHRMASTLTAVALSIIVVLGSATIRQAFHLAALGEEARIERDRAQQVTDVLLRAFDLANPETTNSSDISAREVLDQAADQLRSLADQPASHATLLEAIGISYQGLGLFSDAFGHLTQALEVRRQAGLHVPASLSTGLASINNELGNYEIALGHAAEAITNAATGTDRQDTFLALIEMAAAQRELADYIAAETNLRRALGMADGPVEVAQAGNDLGLALQFDGRYHDAEVAYRDALDQLEKLADEKPFMRSTAHHNLANTLARLSRFDEAEGHFESALAVRIDILGDNHPRVASTHNQYASMLSSAGRYSKAEQHYRAALKIMESANEYGTPRHGSTLNNLALLLARTHQFDEASSTFDAVLGIAHELFGESHPNVASVLNNKGLMLRQRGDYAAAEAAFRQSLTILHSTLDADHPKVAIATNNVGLALLETGRYEAALEHFDRALAIQRDQLGDSHLEVARTLQNIALVHLGEGRLEEAGELLNEALGIARVHAETHPLIATILSNLTTLRIAERRYDEALNLSGQALTMRQAVLTNDHPHVGASWALRAESLWLTGDLAGARSSMEGAMSRLAASLPPDHWRILAANSLHGAIVAASGNLEEGVRLMRTSIDQLESLGHRPLAAVQAKRRLAFVEKQAEIVQEGYGVDH